MIFRSNNKKLVLQIVVEVTEAETETFVDSFPFAEILD